MCDVLQGIYCVFYDRFYQIMGIVRIHEQFTLYSINYAADDFDKNRY